MSFFYVILILTTLRDRVCSIFSGAGKFCLAHGLRQLTRDVNPNLRFPRFTSFPAFFVYPRVWISLPASETDDRSYFLPVLTSCIDFNVISIAHNYKCKTVISIGNAQDVQPFNLHLSTCPRR